MRPKTLLCSLLLVLSGCLAQAAPEPVATPLPLEICYEVAPGDNLWRIAKRDLGHGLCYHDIVDQNSSHYPSLIEDPGYILPGWFFCYRKECSYVE